ncbi:MAG: DUF4373 domain-containing protein [Clostridiaceae bacterium]|mgnify:CR=1 FL=1|nr:DUF4373 domain-containing protein [Clostridiaceae bacterium]
MARPRKEGLDYFPHDTDAVNDEKIEALRMLYGNDGYAFYFILLERIYRTNNAELNISDAETRQILSKKVAITEDKFNQILNSALKYELFDKEAYAQKGVLTSNGIKKRAGIVVEKRLKMRAKYTEKVDKISDAETNQKNRINSEKTPESKEKKSKEKKSKNNINNIICSEIFDYWNSKGIITHKTLTDEFKKDILKAISETSAEDIKKAIDHYAEMFHNKGYEYCSYKWGIHEFLTRKEGYKRFLDDGSKWLNYLRYRAEGKQQIGYTYNYDDGGDSL